MAETLPITIKVHVELDEDSITALSDRVIEALADRMFAAIRRRQANLGPGDLAR